MKKSIKLTAVLITVVMIIASAVSLNAVAENIETSFHGLTGAWNYEGSAFVGKSGGAGDVFAISDITVKADEMFTYEATVTSVTDNPDFNASLIFGLKNTDDPKERFYDFGIMTGSHRWIRFDQTNGIPESGVNVGDLIEQKNTYTVKIVRNSSDEFEYFIDGVSMIKFTHTGFAGGYFGMITNDNGKYENIKITIEGRFEEEPEDLGDYRALSGKWKLKDGVLTGNSNGAGDVFVISNKKVSADDLFTYEATVTSETDNPDFNASLIFGLKNPDDPKERFYDFGIMTGSQRFIRFDQTNGIPESGVDVGNLSENKNTYTVKIVRNSVDEFEYFIDNVSVLKFTHAGFEGGYVGMMTNDNGTYENVKLTIAGNENQPEENEPEENPDTNPPTSDAAITVAVFAACAALAGITVSKKIKK